MNIRGDVSRSMVLRRWLGHLVLFAFVARALIPVGYMPDFAAVANGVYSVVICTAYGSHPIALDANGHKLPGKPGASHHQPCAFSAPITVADLPVEGIKIARRDFITEVASASIFDELPPVRAGPALGSRAPPQLS